MMQYFNMRASRFFSAVIACVASPSISLAQSLWDHNGSQMRLEAQGNARKFVYESPRQGLSAKPGDVLFEGSRSGKTYSGTAYLFSSKCGQIAYKVSGEVGTDDRSVTMSGKAPRRDANCQVTSYTDDKLSFTLMSSSATARSSTSNSIGTQTSTSGQQNSNSSLSFSKEENFLVRSYAMGIRDPDKPYTIASVGKIAGEGEVCRMLDHPIFNRRLEDYKFAPRTNGFISLPNFDQKNQISAWLQGLFNQLAIARRGHFVEIDPSTQQNINEVFSKCVTSPSSEKTNHKITVLMQVFLQKRYDSSCIATNKCIALTAVPNYPSYDPSNIVTALFLKEASTTFIPYLDELNSVIEKNVQENEQRIRQQRLQEERAAKIQEIMGRGDLTTSQKNTMIQQLQ